MVETSFQLPDYFTAFLGSYSTAVSSIRGLSTAVFGACIFLLVRSYGVIRDQDVAPIVGLKLIVASATLAIIGIVSSFFVEGQISWYYSELYKYKLTGITSLQDVIGCEAILDPLKYFDDCLRKRSLKYIFSTSILAAVLSCLSLFAWFLMQTWQVSRQKK